MSEKVKITKEQAEAIEHLLNTPFCDKYKNNPECIISTHANNKANRNNWWIGKSTPLNDMTLDTLIRALYIGYEVEKSNEEKAVEWMVRNSAFTGARCEWYINRIAKILNGEEPDA
jgi:hypothetical protein